MGDGKVVLMVVCAFVVGVIALVGILVGFSLKKLDSAEVAIQYNTYTKELNPEPFYEGLHLGPPGFSFIKFPSVFKSLSFSRLSCLNEDGVTVRISTSFQYRVRTTELEHITTQFKDEGTYITVLRLVGASAIHDACSVFTTSQFQSDRGSFQAYMTRRLVEKFDIYGCDVTDLQVKDVTRPNDYESAIRDKESSREDIEVARNERPRQLTEARTRKLEAETEAQIILDAANTEASILITRATADGQGILNEYIKEAESYKQLKQDNGLDNEGFLSYMGIRAISNAKNPVRVGMKAPAETSFT